jgi:hypothetical protein
MASKYYPSLTTTFSPSPRSFSDSPTDLFSPASPAYSDASSEGYQVCLLTRPPTRSSPRGCEWDHDDTDRAPTQDSMAIGNDPLHISDVMADVLNDLNRVVEHVRDASPGLQDAGLTTTTRPAKRRR